MIKPSLFLFLSMVFKCHVSVVYAKCSRAEIIELWNHLISQDITGPWVVGGDFNIVSSSHEKAGGSMEESGSHWSYNQTGITNHGLIAGNQLIHRMKLKKSCRRLVGEPVRSFSFYFFI